MKKVSDTLFLLLLLPLLAPALASCESQEPAAGPDSDYVEVQFAIPGNYGNPFSPTTSSSRVSYEEDLADPKYEPHKLDENSTLWLLLEEIPDEASAESRDTFTENMILRPFVVDANGILMPCTVDDQGNLDHLTTTPLYLKRDQWYRARAIGPALPLLPDSHSMYIKNNQYVYAHDYRYAPTKHAVFEVKYDAHEPEKRIYLNPVIHQNAELKFTIVAEEIETPVLDDDGNPVLDDLGNPKMQKYSPVHTLEVMPAGVVVTGLQTHYSLGPVDEDHEPYNWTLGQNYLHAYPGDVHSYMTIYNPVEVSTNPPKLVFKGAILPTDAVANPVIVGFYLRVNGVPTMFQMMLNKKMFLHAFSYHYLGVVKIQSGIAVLEWQAVAHETDTDIPVINNSYLTE